MKMETNARGFLVPQSPTAPTEMRDGECWVNSKGEHFVKENGKIIPLKPAAKNPLTTETPYLIALLAFDIVMLAMSFYPVVFGVLGLIVLGLLVWRIGK